MIASMAIPIHLSMVPLKAKRIMRTSVKAKKGMLRRMVSLLAGMGCITAVRPRMSAMLQMLEPATLPMAMLEDPIHAAWALTQSSGMDVPNPITVSPITIGLSLARCAIATEPSIRKSPPLMRRRRPEIIKMYGSI